MSAFSPDDIPGAAESAACMEVAPLLTQLGEVQSAMKRSITAEVESAIESGACLVDEAGRGRVLGVCKAVRQSAARLSQPERALKIQVEL